MLKIIEGAEIEVPPKGGRKHPTQETIKVDTSNMLFIVSGAFEGLEQIIEKRLNKDKSGIGFNSSVLNQDEAQKDNILHDVRVEDLKKYGMIPELLGRFPVICAFDELTHEALVKILTEPKNSIVKQYKKLFEIDNVELDFEDDALVAIADLAIQRKTGARALRGIVEDILRPLMFSTPNDPNIVKIVITKDYVNGNQNAVLITKKETA